MEHVCINHKRGFSQFKHLKDKKKCKFVSQTTSHGPYESDVSKQNLEVRKMFVLMIFSRYCWVDFMCEKSRKNFKIIQSIVMLNELSFN